MTVVAQWGAGSQARGTRPLVVALHGYGASAADLVRLAPFVGEFDLVSLQAPHPQGSGWMWFPLAVPGVPDVAAVQVAATAVLDWIDTTVPADRTVVVLGFSQGGTTALQVARNRPGRVAGVVLLSGFVAPGSLPGDAELQARGLPVFWGRDLADPVIAPVAIDRTTAYLPAHTAATVRTYQGIGHGIGRAELIDVRAFLAGLVGGVSAADG